MPEMDITAAALANERIDRTADMVERRVAAAAMQIQAQFMAMTKLIDQRVDGNKEQSEARLNALDALIVTRVAALRDWTEAATGAIRERAEERWSGWKLSSEQRANSIAMTAEHSVRELEALIGARLEANDKATELQAREYERRLQTLNHHQEAIDRMQDGFVRNEVFRLEMDRIYSERRDQQASAEAQRIAQETLAATNRRNTMLTGITAAVSLIAVVISVLLHYVPSVPGASP